MKFGKEFRTHLEETLPEWRDKFLCYKPLKKLLKRFPHTILINNTNINHDIIINNNNHDITTQNQHDVGINDGGRGPTDGGGPNSSESGPTERSMSLEEFQDWFVRLLNDELDKLNDFYVEKEEDFVIRFQVTSPQGINYHYKDVVESGDFAFTAAQTGDYMTCFWAPYHNPPSKISIEFDWKTGVEARDWFNVARKGQLDVLNTEMRRLYDSVTSIHDEMFYLREREEEMELLNRSTKSNMIVLSFFSIIIVLSVAVLQVWHLKLYFESKKLL